MKVAPKKVTFAGVGSPGKSLKTWPRSGFRVCVSPLPEPTEPKNESLVSQIFYGSLNLRDVDRESLFHAILTSLDEPAPNSLELWVVLNSLLKGDGFDVVDSDHAEFILTRAKLQIADLVASSSDVLSSRLLIQTLRVVDTLLATPDVEGNTDPDLIHVLLEQCVSILESRDASKALVGAAIHVVNHVHDVMQHLGIRLSHRLLASFEITRSFSLGSVMGEFLSCCTQLVASHRQLAVMEASSWVPIVIRGLLGNSPFVRTHAVSLIMACARSLTFEENLGRAFEAVLGASTTSSMAPANRPQSFVEGESVISVLSRRLLGLLTSSEDAQPAMDAWSGILLLVVCGRPNSEWAYLGKWLDIVRVGLQFPDVAARDACLVAWRTVVALFTFAHPAEIATSALTKRAAKSTNGLLQPFKGAAEADKGTAELYWHLFHTVLYSAMSVSQPNFGALWDSIVAPISRIFFENPDYLVRKDALQIFVHLVTDGCDADRQVPQWDAPKDPGQQLRRRLEPLFKSERDGFETIAPLPSWWVRQNQSRVLTFFKTIVEDCDLTSSEMLSLWQCVVRITSSEVRVKDAAADVDRMKRIVELTAFIQTNKRMNPLAPQLARILLGKIGVSVLAPRKLNQVNRQGLAVVTFSDHGTTSALSVLVATIMRDCRDTTIAQGVLNEILGFAKTSVESAQVIARMFEAAASSPEYVWQMCAQKLVQLQDNQLQDNQLRDDQLQKNSVADASVVVDGLTAALAIEPLPREPKTWALWAQLFTLAIRSSSEDELLNILDRVPGFAAAGLLPLKADTLRDRPAFDSALMRIAIDGSLLNASVVVDAVVGGTTGQGCILPDSFSRELARQLIMRNASAYDVDYRALVSAALRLLGPSEAAANADILLGALQVATTSHRQVLVDLWNEKIAQSGHNISADTHALALRLKSSIALDLVIPVLSTLTPKSRSPKSRLPKTSPRKRRNEFPSDGSPVKRRRMAALATEFADIGVLSPPPSSETGLEDENAAPQMSRCDDNDSDVGHDSFDSDPLSSSPPRPRPSSNKESDLDRMRTIKHALIGMGSGDAFAGMKRSECETMRGLLFSCLVRLKVHMSAEDAE